MRMGRSLLNYPPAKVLEFHVFGPDMSNPDPLASLRDHIAHLVRGSVHVHEAWPAQRTLRLVTDGLSVGVNVEGDVELQKVLARIKKQLEDGKKEAERLEGKLGNKEFVAKAPPEVVVEQRQRLSTLYKDQAILESSDAQIRSMLAELGP